MIHYSIWVSTGVSENFTTDFCILRTSQVVGQVASTKTFVISEHRSSTAQLNPLHSNRYTRSKGKEE